MENSITVRFLNENDIKSLQELFNKSDAQLHSNFTPDIIEEDNEFVIGVFFDNSLVGFCSVGEADTLELSFGADPGDLLLSDVYIRPEERNKGFGSFLVQGATMLGFKMHPTAMYCHITLLDGTLSTWYARMGFEKTMADEFGIYGMRKKSEYKVINMNENEQKKAAEENLFSESTAPRVKLVQFEIETALGKEKYICVIDSEKKSHLDPAYTMPLELQCEEFLAEHCFCDAYEILSVRDCTEEEVKLLEQYQNEENMTFWEAQTKVCYPNGDSINEQIYNAARRKGR